MKKLALLGVFAIIFSLGLVFAQDAEVLMVSDELSADIVYADPLSIDSNGELMINLVSPADGVTFSTTSNFDVNFEFTVSSFDSRLVYADRTTTSKNEVLVAPSGKIKCTVIISGDSDHEISRSLLPSGGSISVDKELGPENYEWKVKCRDSTDREWSSELRDFEISLIPTNTNSNSEGNGGSNNNNNDDESNGRRLQPISLPLEDLSTDLTSDEEESSGFSAITGAVIGAVGKRGFYGIIGLLLFVAILGAYVYNKRKEEQVKKVN